MSRGHARPGPRLPRRPEPAAEPGVHAHENLSVAVANCVVAVEEGAAGGRSRRPGRFQEDMIVDIALHLGRAGWRVVNCSTRGSRRCER